MKNGEQYRVNKGERLRTERGVATVNDELAKGALDLFSAGLLVPVVSKFKVDGLCPQAIDR
jgi:hypothetical protein